MMRRPWPLVLLALLQVSTPIFNVLVNAWALGLPISQFLHLTCLTESWLSLFAIFLLGPMSGLAIYMMKKWSYPVFLLAVGWTALDNLRAWKTTSSVIPLPLAIAAYVVDIILVTYFILPQVRAVYFNPRIRWWESRPRFTVKLPCQTQSSGTESSVAGAILDNIAEGGVFYHVPLAPQTGSEVELSFSILDVPYRFKAQILHYRLVKEGEVGVGAQFLHTPESLKRIKDLMTALEKIGLPRRPVRESALKDFTQWAALLFKTGKGLVPQLPDRTK